MKPTELKISTLRPYRYNARVHQSDQVDALANAIREFGFTNPILVDKKNNVIAGHGRLEAAKKLGMERVPAIRLSDLSDEDVRAYRLADNKLGDMSAWDEYLLEKELKELDDMGFNKDDLGFGDVVFEADDYNVHENNFDNYQPAIGDVSVDDGDIERAERRLNTFVEDKIQDHEKRKESIQCPACNGVFRVRSSDYFMARKKAGGQ